jgi:anti-sigma regulatory factor (Ser/Thr protein kinase)
MHPFTKDVSGICDGDVSTLVLEPDEQAPARARRFVAERFAAWGVTDDHNGRIIVSELVTNALLHGEGPIVLRVFRDERDGLPTIEVWDGGAGRPVVRQESLTSIGGRGLLMVAGLALGWGTRPLTEGGKLTWAKCGL